MTNKEIQQALIARGYDLGPGRDDGDIGPVTIKAVKAFQKSAGLIADGVPGPLTQAALKALDVSTVKAPAEHDTLPPWLVIASSLIGTKEGPGLANNPVVVKMFADAGFPGIKVDSTAWCAGFVNACLERVGIKGSRSLAARSFESWGVGIPLANPVLGCIATKKRGGNAPAWQGHTGIVVGANKDHVFLLGGNQGDAVNISAFKRSEIVAFRWPSGIAIPTGGKLPTSIAGAKSNVTEG